MQKHWDVMRSDDAGESWHEISGNLPTDFGFPIDVHAHEPDTVYVVPITSDSEHFPPDGKLRVYRSRTGGNEWEPLTKGLPQEHCYVNVLRDAMAVDSLDSCGVYFGTTGGQVYASADAATAGRRSCATCRRCCRSRSRRCHDPGRAARASAHAGPGRRRGGARGRRARSPSARCSTRSRPRYPHAARHDPRPRRRRRGGAFIRFFACDRTCPTSRPDTPLPEPCRGRDRALPDRRSDGRRLMRSITPSDGRIASGLIAMPENPDQTADRAVRVAGTEGAHRREPPASPPTPSATPQTSPGRRAAGAGSTVNVDQATGNAEVTNVDARARATWARGPPGADQDRRQDRPAADAVDAAARTRRMRPPALSSAGAGAPAAVLVRVSAGAAWSARATHRAE